MYKRTKGPRGRWLYFKNGKMVSVKSIPQEELDKLNGDVQVETTPTERKCLFCGEPGTEPMFINLQHLDLCMEHYLNKTKGEVVQKLKETHG